MQKDVKNFVFFIQSDILLLYFDFMTRIPYTLIALLSSLFFSINTYAAEDNILWVSQDRGFEMGILPMQIFLSWSWVR